ncbi:MAG: threonine dehydratase [Lysobacteraceae bacterium]|jgi:threonine dehydratase|nr:threonine dehydratase [Xanthomonadaceae bacterium]MCZ8319447.1 threonine dehydratase [Silanimonas sp.]
MPLDAARADVTASDVLAASARLRRYLPPTPLHYAERFGCWLKLENLQRTGAYKVRGALNALLAARERGDRRTVITASAGNHAMGLAWAARELKVPVITVMPMTAPVVKAQGVAFLGATVRQSGQTYDEAKAHALQLAEQHGFRYLSAFDDPDVIAGQGTLGIELAAHAPEAVLVPIGGGGLAAGVALALKSQGVRIIGAQVEGVDAMARALKGDASPIMPRPTLADGTRVAEPGTLTREILSRLLDDLIIVREAELRETLARLMLEEHIVAEGAGALALAAGRRVASRRKVAVVSGGNIDAAVFAQLLLDTRPRPPRPPRRRAADPFTAGASTPTPTTSSAVSTAGTAFSKTPEGSLP